MLTRNQLLYGSDTPPPQRTALRAGPLSIVFEASGDLRYIRLGDCELIRRIYVAVRDPRWRTIPGIVSNLHVQTAEDAFEIRFDVEHRQDPIHFTWSAAIRGTADGTVRFAMDGVARTTFMTNRVGLCLLHPAPAAADTPLRITRPDGSTEQGLFPLHVRPHQPFTDIAAIEHEVSPALWARVQLDGDVFEMEDQRNWTDGSYKTYSGPLSRPIPAQITQGTLVRQSATLSLVPTQPPDSAGFVPTKPALGDRPVTFAPTDAPAQPLPAIGLGMAGHGQELGSREIYRLRRMGIAHLRLDLHLSDPATVASLQRATYDSKIVGVPLEMALYVSDQAEAELSELLRYLNRLQPDVRRWLIFHENESVTSPRWVSLARQILRDHDWTAQFGGGTDQDFVALNRNRPAAGDDGGAFDLLSYTMTPQVHTTDNGGLIESLGAQGATLQTARNFAGGRPLVISPITLKRRRKPVPADIGPGRDAGPVSELPADVDPRQMSLFAAGWTIGSIAAIAQVGGASSLTYFQTTGWCGVMDTQAGSPLPDRFPAVPGGVFPLYHAIADIGALAGGQVVPATSSDPLRLVGITLQRGPQKRLMVANLSDAPLDVVVQRMWSTVSLRQLDEHSAQHAMTDPETFRNQRGQRLLPRNGQLELNLPPLAIATIDELLE